MHLSISHLATFLMVVQQGSMTSAALTLNYALSTVSTHVALLERQLRGELLLRSPDGCVPTELGRRVAEGAQQILAVHDTLTSVTARAQVPHQHRGAIRAAAGGPAMVTDRQR